MPSSQLTALTLKNFKSIFDITRIEFGDLTVFVGKNNSGKSTIVQALLLLKQTLEARTDNRLNLSGGYLTARNLRELISGWPDDESLITIDGPVFYIEWKTLEFHDGKQKELNTALKLDYADADGKVLLRRIELVDLDDSNPYTSTIVFTSGGSGDYECMWEGRARKKMEVDVHHFVPTISINRRNVGPRDGQRILAQKFTDRYVRPLDELEKLLKTFSFLSSTRTLPPQIYTPSTTVIEDIGVSGEFAAEILWAHKSDLVHYLLPNFEDVNASAIHREDTLKNAVDEVLHHLGIDTRLSMDEVYKVGFRLLFGKATLAHVGRGLTYLLPIVQLGLFSDPQRFKKLADINPSALEFRLCAFEEPEAHLHPKVQSRLATWFVSLARSSRQVLVETHSDHLVRRLRKMAAEAHAGSELESWLSTKVRVITVSQQDGRTQIRSTPITKIGSLEVWPPDFMDAAANSEEEIYQAALKKEIPDLQEGGSIEYMNEGEPDADC
jgi:predicted ATPase